MTPTLPPPRPSAILVPASAPWRSVLRALVVAAMLVVVGLVLRAAPVDSGLARALDTWHTGAVGAVCDAVYAVFEPVPAVLLTVAVTGVVWAATRRWLVAAAFAGTVALTWIPSDVVKLLVHRPRPDGATLPHPFAPVQVDPSFPSGHVVFVASLVIALVFLLRGTRWARVVAVGGAVLVAVVALALAVDTVHWPTDVAASVVWALAVAPAARAVWVDLVLVPVARRREQTGRHRAVTGEDAS